MYLSRLNPGYDYSSQAYRYDKLPDRWFELFNNLPQNDYEDYLDYFAFGTAIASWYESDDILVKHVKMGISVLRRKIYIKEYDNDTAQPRYFTFYERPFDAKSSLTSIDGNPYGVIVLNQHGLKTQQLELMINIGNEERIEGFNTALLLFAVGDKLLNSYEVTKDAPIYCQSFSNIGIESYDINHIPPIVFNCVHCREVDADGMIAHRSLSKLSKLPQINKNELIKEIHRITEFVLEYNRESETWENESKEEIIWRHLDYTDIFSIEPIKYPIINRYYEMNEKKLLHGLNFCSLNKCKRIGCIPQEKMIIAFGNNHCERFEFRFETRDEMYGFGKVLISYRKLYKEINDYFAYEEGCYERKDNDNDVGFFLKTNGNTDEHFFVDRNSKGDSEQTQQTSIVNNQRYVKQPTENISFDTASQMTFDELESLIGLDGVKKDVRELTNLVRINSRKSKLGLPIIPVSLHLIFTGNPGTGKTTVARILADIYKKIGVLSKGQLVEVDRSALVAGYVGQTALKTQAKIQEAKGGILFIDEAYTLAKDGNDFGQEAIDTILKAMEDNRGDLVVIVAGYPELMKTFINSNPGLRSRFNKYIVFEDYSTDELYAIFMSMCKQYNLTLNDSAEARLRDIVQKLVMKKDENFANARDIRNIFEKAITKQANRIAMKDSITESEMLLITEEDFG